MKKRLAAALLLASVLSQAQDEFSVKIENGSAVLRSGSLCAKTFKSCPSLTVSSPLGSDTLQPLLRDLKAEELSLVVDSEDRKAVAWLGEPSLQGGSLTQFTCVFEIRRGVEAVFVSSRLYNREDSISSNCYLAWTFRAKFKSFESDSGAISLAGASQKLKGVSSWALFHEEGESKGLCLVFGGMDDLTRKLSSNGLDWPLPPAKPKVWMYLSSNHPDDGLMGTTGIYEKIKKIKPGKFNEIKFAAFQAEDASSASARAAALLADPELASLVRY